MVASVALFARRRIVTGRRQTLPDRAPLYRRLLGDAFAALPPSLQTMHDVTGELVAEGVFPPDDRGVSLSVPLLWGDHDG